MVKVKYEKPAIMDLKSGAVSGYKPDLCATGTGASANCAAGTGGSQNPDNCKDEAQRRAAHQSEESLHQELSQVVDGACQVRWRRLACKALRLPATRPRIFTSALVTSAWRNIWSQVSLSTRVSYNPTGSPVKVKSGLLEAAKEIHHQPVDFARPADMGLVPGMGDGMPGRVWQARDQPGK